MGKNNSNNNLLIFIKFLKYFPGNICSRKSKIFLLRFLYQKPFDLFKYLAFFKLNKLYYFEENIMLTNYFPGNNFS